MAPLAIKRKNIDLPLDIWDKLSSMAAAQNRSLKNFVETVLISKATGSHIDVYENPSPSGDEWFNDFENMESVKRGISEMGAGAGKRYSMEDIDNLLEL